MDRRVRWTQVKLNEFFDSRNLTYKPLELDGDLGPMTKRNIRHARYYLGLGRALEAQSSEITDELILTLKSPRRRLKGWSVARNARRVATAGRRQRRRKAEVKKAKTGVARIAQSYVGRTERNNRAPWLDAWARTYVGSWMVGQPWCGLFCIAVWARAGKKLPSGTVYTPNIVNWARRGQYFNRVSPANARAGDLVVFNFPGGSSVADHVGLAVGPAKGGVIPCIEGNTSPGSGGSQANGGGVYRRTRPVGLVAVVARPK